MSDTPTIAQKGPYPVDIVEGQTYYYCTCGKSTSQPFCDGSHQGSNFEPIAYTAETTGTVYLCGCKHTKSAPMCDGSHNEL
jgi:CDGSH-type Zn-finger protein